MVGDILQPTHLLFVLLVALLVLGPKRLPEVGKTLGSGLRDFRDALSGETSHDRHARDEYREPEPVQAAPEQRHQAPVEPDPVPAEPVAQRVVAVPAEPAPAPLEFSQDPEPATAQPVAPAEPAAADPHTQPDA